MIAWKQLVTHQSLLAAVALLLSGRRVQFLPNQKTAKVMTMELEESNLPRESPSKFFEGLAEKLGAAARAATIFGDPVEREGVTIVPVARARWGFGGGVGRKKDEDGAGGGGGAQITPVGLIELKNGAAEFRPIRTVSLPWMIAGGLATVFLLGQALRRNNR
jgi:sporulation protein YtfJ